MAKSKGRSKFDLSLEPPNKNPPQNPILRNEWIDEVCANFVSSSDANKSYYRVMLETLWPPNHSIPGPHVSEDEIRQAVNNFRRAQHIGDAPYKPYVDVFRRLRELQGEEGVTGIAREGRNFQLVSLNIDEKREPRTKLSHNDWSIILEKYNYKCPVCGRGEPEVKFDQDHKVPRSRGGSNDLDNWQPLCFECNNIKSTACRGCELDCQKCSWAFPERYAPLKISSENIQSMRKLANKLNINVHDLANQILYDYILSIYNS